METTLPRYRETYRFRRGGFLVLPDGHQLVKEWRWDHRKGERVCRYLCECGWKTTNDGHNGPAMTHARNHHGAR